MLAGFVQGPCEVLPFRKFGDEAEKSDQGSPAKDRRQPVFIRKYVSFANDKFEAI